MTERIEFGSKAAADQFRDEHVDHLCSDDDRRLKTVAISSNAPDHVLETATIPCRRRALRGSPLTHRRWVLGRHSSVSRHLL